MRRHGRRNSSCLIVGQQRRSQVALTRRISICRKNNMSFARKARNFLKTVHSSRSKRKAGQAPSSELVAQLTRPRNGSRNRKKTEIFSAIAVYLESEHSDRRNFGTRPFWELDAYREDVLRPLIFTDVPENAESHCNSLNFCKFSRKI